MAPGSVLLRCGFAAIAAAVVLLFALGYAWAGRSNDKATARRRHRFLGALGGGALWMAATGAVAASGVLAKFDARPPPFVLVLLAALGLGITIALSRIGARLADGLPLAALVGAQAFRLPLELVMHEAARQGVMPVQMSFSGYNFDILSGITAVVVASMLAAGAAPRGLVAAWNIFGSLLLVTIIVIAMASTPPIHAFGTTPDRLNTFIAYFPYIWLAVVMVPGAIAGHLLIARRLRKDGRAGS
jgi:hypothetical protein